MIQTHLDNHGVDLELDLSNALPKVWGHPHSLEQVVLNLLSNPHRERDTGDRGKKVDASDWEGETFHRFVLFMQELSRTLSDCGSRG